MNKTERKISIDTATVIATALAKTTAEVTAGIMKELSDIKMNLAVNTVETKNLGIKLEEIKQGNSAQIRDHESRIRRIELWGAMLIGGLYAIQLIIGWYLVNHK